MSINNISKKIEPMNQPHLEFWSLPAAELLAQLQTTPQGVTSDEARKRLERYGSNLLIPRKRSDSLALFLAQFKSPINLILLFAAGLSFFLHEHIDVLIILAIVFISGLLGFWQERGAANAIEKLLAIVQIKAMALRDGSQREIPVEEIVPGDVIILNGGDIIPGDCLILESKDLFVDEATLTGETYPVEKSAGELVKETQLGQRSNTAKKFFSMLISMLFSRRVFRTLLTTRSEALASLMCLATRNWMKSHMISFVSD